MVGIEEVGEGIGNRKRYRLVVAKVALDELRKGGLTIRAVFNMMLHRYSKPGYFLLNAPYASKGTKNTQYLPQIADAVFIREHKKGCPAVTSTCADRAAREGLLRDFAASHTGDKFNANREWPWAADAMLENCTCFRSRRIALSTGCKMPDLIRKNFVAILGGSDTAIAQNGLGDTSKEQLDCTVEHLSWVAHVKRLTGRSPDDMTAAELKEANLHNAHPNSTYWITPGPSR